jgi:acyl-CoA dehydrogenase
MASGELVGAIAMTEPGTGSDLQNVRTVARRDGDHYVINGSKTFITNGQNANLIIVVQDRQDRPRRRRQGHLAARRGRDEDTLVPGFAAAATSTRSA